MTMQSFIALFQKQFALETGEYSDSLTPDDVMLWDSLGHMSLVAEIEDEYGVEFEVDEITEMTTAGKIRELLTAKKEGT